MCYAIPGKVVELKNNIAVVNYFGELRNVLNEFSETKVGDYVYAQGGILINKIPEKEALEILEFWKNDFFKLKEIDQKLSTIKAESDSTQLLSILQDVNFGKTLTNDQLLTLLNISNKEEIDLLIQTANNVRQKEHDNACCVHGIIEFSNYCNRNCYYCGIRKDQDISRYRMTVDQIIDTAKKAATEQGFKAFVLQSGEDPYYDEEKLIQVVTEIRKLDVLIFLSIGVRSKELYEKLYQAGARAVLLRFETSNKEIFEKLRPKTKLAQRIQLIKVLKQMGYLIATGFLIGLPEETDQDVINNIELTKELDSDMFSFGPLIPTKGTPLEKSLLPAKDRVLKTIAISRFIDRRSKILVTTALETLDPDAKKQGLLAGANSLMINITPKNLAKQYLIYDNKAGTYQELDKNVKQTIELLYSIGRAPTDLGL